jgi:CheY-like chemotaxis protein
MRLLIVDDSLLVRSQLKEFFSSIGSIIFEEAVNGIEALEKHRSFRPDVIILDYIIPAPDGLAILKILRKIDEDVKIIMATTLGNQKFIYRDCLDGGAFAILTKPIIKENALKIINSI